MKHISTKRAKSTQISTRTKKAVYDRDNGLCVVCGRRGFPDAHYVPRFKGGLGIEENLVTLCRECHDKFDHGDEPTMITIGIKVRNYLKEHYPDIEYPDIRYYPGKGSKLVYKKYDGWEWNYE